MIEYFSQPGLILVSGKFYSLRKKMYAFSLYRYDVCFYGGSTVGGELRFCQEDLVVFGIVFFPIVFAFSVRTIAIFSTIATVLGVRERFLLTGVSFLFPFQ